VSSKCVEPRPKKTDSQTQFVFLICSAAECWMMAEDELELLSVCIGNALQIQWDANL